MNFTIKNGWILHPAILVQPKSFPEMSHMTPFLYFFSESFALKWLIYLILFWINSYMYDISSPIRRAVVRPRNFHPSTSYMLVPWRVCAFLLVDRCEKVVHPPGWSLNELPPNDEVRQYYERAASHH